MLTSFLLKPGEGEEEVGAEGGVSYNWAIGMPWLQISVFDYSLL